jgi:hypothetical protein
VGGVVGGVAGFVLLLLLVLLVLGILLARRSGRRRRQKKLRQPNFSVLAYGEVKDAGSIPKSRQQVLITARTLTRHPLHDTGTAHATAPLHADTRVSQALEELEQLLISEDGRIVHAMTHKMVATDADKVFLPTIKSACVMHSHLCLFYVRNNNLLQMSKAVMCVFESNQLGYQILEQRISREVEAAPDAGTLFRSNSLSVRMFSFYVRMVGLQYLCVDPSLFDLRFSFWFLFIYLFIIVFTFYLITHSRGVRRWFTLVTSVHSLNDNAVESFGAESGTTRPYTPRTAQS